MRELWRVTAPNGRLIVVVPRRGGFWAQADNTPFGSGYPFSRGQLEKLLPELGELTAFGREECDLTDRVWLRTTIRLLEPKLIINATGFTDVNLAERNPDLAWSINAGAPALLADEAALLGAGLVHYSTDYIFDGQKKEPYLETDDTFVKAFRPGH